MRTFSSAISAFGVVVLVLHVMFGRMLMAFPNPDDVAPQINALWRVLGVPFRIELTWEQ